MLEFFRDPFALAFLIQTNFFAYLILCFVLRLLLFNFQGSSPPLSEQLCYYTTFVPFCQPLFQSFFNFFSGFPSVLSVARPPLLCGDLFIIPLSIRFVNTFFKVFRSFFHALSCVLNSINSFQADAPSFLRLATALCDSFHIILLFSTFVKGFIG